MTAVTRTYELPKFKYAGFKEELAKLEKKYHFVYDIFEEDEYSHTFGHPDYDMDVTVHFIKVTVFINLPGYQIEGWDYLGCVKDEFSDGIFTSHGNEVAEEKGISLHEIMKEHNHIPCEHCGRKHTRRKIGHLFRKHEDGEVRTFGSTCARKYFGINFLSMLNKFERIFRRLTDSEFRSDCPAFRDIIDTQFFFHMAHYSISNFGYVSATAARDDETKNSTTDHVRAMISTLNSIGDNKYKKELREALSNHESDFNKIKDAEWVSEKDSYTDFDNNIIVLRKRFDNNMITWRNLGLYVWVIFDKIFKPELEKAEKVSWNNDPDYEEKDKIKDIDLEIVNVSGFDGSYGWTFIYTFRGPNNVRFKWFTGNNIVGDEWQGKVVHMNSGSVKKIEKSDKYGTAVVLTRCRMRK